MAQPILSTIAALTTAVCLTGCTPASYPMYATNQALYAELFHKCMKALPAGPLSTKYNDWDEVVKACSEAAYYQSQYCYENCPPEDIRALKRN